MPTLDFKERPGDPTAERWMEDLYGTKLGKAGRYYRDILKRLGRGDDVSSMPFLQTMRDTFERQRQGIEHDYMTGANQLVANQGGDQALLLNRMRQYEMDRQRQGEGSATAEALTGLSDVAGSGLIAARGQQLGAKTNALQGRLGYWQNRYVPYEKQTGWEKFMDVGKLLVGGAQAAAGLGAKPFG